MHQTTAPRVSTEQSRRQLLCAQGRPSLRVKRISRAIDDDVAKSRGVAARHQSAPTRTPDDNDGPANGGRGTRPS